MRMLLDTFGQTLGTLWGHKLRSFLTMFGIAWGVGSLLLLVGVGQGFRNGNRRQLETFGKNDPETEWTTILNIGAATIAGSCDRLDAKLQYLAIFIDE
jgi:ABC-type antimicrobial peptide transport system permease subunit